MDGVKLSTYHDFVHVGYICDGKCESTAYITNTCFVCNECTNACFCNKCDDEHRRSAGHSTHWREKLHESIACDGTCIGAISKSPISGDRYKCDDCPDADFCKQCAPNHAHGNHWMTKNPLPASTTYEPDDSSDESSKDSSADNGIKFDKESTASSISPPHSPVSPTGSHTDKLPIQDRWDDTRYREWLRGLSDWHLQQEEKRCAMENISANAGIFTNAVTAPFTAPVTGFVSLGAHAASVAYKQSRSIYYFSHRKLCREELARRKVAPAVKRDRDTAKAIAGGIVRTVVPRLGSLFN